MARRSAAAGTLCPSASWAAARVASALWISPLRSLFSLAAKLTSGRRTLQMLTMLEVKHGVRYCGLVEIHKLHAMGLGGSTALFRQLTIAFVSRADEDAQ